LAPKRNQGLCDYADHNPEGRDETVSRRQVQTWYLDTANSGGPIWGWLGQRLDIEQAEKAALSLYRGFLSDVDAWTGAAPTGAENTKINQPSDRHCHVN
jgi:hypothetical protein